MNKTLFSWSSGKDAALGYYYLKQKQPVDGLFTTINSAFQRVSMHGLQCRLLEAQAQALNIPLEVVPLPQHTTMASYNEALKKSLKELHKKGYSQCGFGDIFLEDLKTYREEFFCKQGYKTHFPLWKKDTSKLVKEMITLGFKAITVCVKADLLDKSFVGREINHEFLDALPVNVDPCGENGEFHTFCYAGPLFKHPIPFRIGEKVFRDYRTKMATQPTKKNLPYGFWYCDLHPD